MKSIKWVTSKYSSGTVVGAFNLSCVWCTSKLKRPWCAIVYCTKVSSMSNLKYGPMRKTVKEAQEDAVLLARELLLDIQTCLNSELANFGLEPGDEE